MSDRWLELSVQAGADEMDDVSATVSRWVGSALAVETGPSAGNHDGGRAVLRAYVPDGPGCAATRCELEQALWHLGATGSPGLRAPQARWIESADYLTRWRRFYQPLEIGRRHMIAPSWIEPPDTDRRVIRMDPAMAFGTGRHPTTRMSVATVEEGVTPGDVVVDVGTGSGLLAIVAAYEGAARVRAYDTDIDSVRASRANVMANGVAERVEVVHGRLDPETAPVADLLVANIVADVHLEQMDLYRRSVRVGARVILGGILEGRAPEVVGAALRAGFDGSEAREADGWTNLTLTATVVEPSIRSESAVHAS